MTSDRASSLSRAANSAPVAAAPGGPALLVEKANQNGDYCHRTHYSGGLVGPHQSECGRNICGNRKLDEHVLHGVFLLS